MSASDKTVVNAANIKKENIYPVSLDQQRSFMARSRGESEVDDTGIWTAKIDLSGDDDFFFSNLGGDFIRGGFTYGNRTSPVDPNVSKKEAIEKEKDRLAEHPQLYKRSEEGKKVTAEFTRLEKEYQELVQLEGEKEPLSKSELAAIAKSLLQEELKLTLEQARNFARSVQQKLYGYHKDLVGYMGKVDFTVAFSLEGEGDDAKIIIKLHTKTDPELYSEFEIMVSDLTNANANGEPQRAPRAPIKLVYTGDVSKIRPGLGIENMDMEDFLNVPPIIPTGRWDNDGYHYYDAKKNARFNSHQKPVGVSNEDEVLKKEQEERQKQRDHSVAKVKAEYSRSYVRMVFDGQKEINEDLKGVEFTSERISEQLKADKEALKDMLAALDAKKKLAPLYKNRADLHKKLAQVEENGKKGFIYEVIAAMGAALSTVLSFSAAIFGFSPSLASLPKEKAVAGDDNQNIRIQLERVNQRINEIKASDSCKGNKYMEWEDARLQEEANKINKVLVDMGEKEAIPANPDVASLIAAMEAEAPKPNAYGSSHVVSDLEKRSDKAPYTQAEALDKCGFLAKSNSQPPVLPSSQPVPPQSTGHLDPVSLRFG